MFLFIISLLLLGLVIYWLATCIVVVPQAHTYVIERLGAYLTSWQAGLHLRLPIIDKVVRRISLKEQVSDFEPQPVITKDNVTMQIDTVVYWQVFDSNKFTYGIERPIAAIENLTATTLRNIIGDLTLDETLTSRDTINSKLLTTIDDATDKWGIKVNRVELKNIMPPAQIQEAMEKQMRAEREKREKILQAEGEKQSEITRAEGEKEAAILRADAVKEKRIREADGEAQALLKIQQANANALKLLNEAQPSNKVLTLKSLEALKDVANGHATKIIVPSDLQNLSGLLPAAKELIEKDN